MTAQNFKDNFYYDFLKQNPNTVMNIREYYDPRSQNLPGHSPVSADEYEGSEPDYRNSSEHGNISDYEHIAYDNVVDDQNGLEDPSNFRCMTPGSNLPLRGSSITQPHHHHVDDMLENISSDAMIMMPDTLDHLNTVHDDDDLSDNTGHFTVGLARATGTNATTVAQSFINSESVLGNGTEEQQSNTDYITGGSVIGVQPTTITDASAAEFFQSGMVSFPSMDPDEHSKYGERSPSPLSIGHRRRSQYIKDSWPPITSKQIVISFMTHKLFTTLSASNLRTYDFQLKLMTLFCFWLGMLIKSHINLAACNI